MKNGKDNEIAIIQSLSGLTYQELSEKWKKHVKKMFPEIKEQDKITAYFYRDAFAKPDIVVTVNDRSVYISIKSGKNPSCHHENFSDFSYFLIKQGVPDRIIRILSFYQFGRSDKLSNNGVAFTKEEIQTKFKPYVLEASEYFLKHPQIVRKIIHRSLIRGTRYYGDEVDFFYYGNSERGFILSREEVYNEILKDEFIDSKTLHFYALVFQPDGRKEDRPNHLFIRIKWPVLSLRFYDEEFLQKYS